MTENVSMTLKNDSSWLKYLYFMHKNALVDPYQNLIMG